MSNAAGRTRLPSPPPLVTKDDRVFVDDTDVTHVVPASIARYYLAGTLKTSPMRARCAKASGKWGPREGDVVTCAACVRYLRRKSLAYVAGGARR